MARLAQYSQHPPFAAARQVDGNPGQESPKRAPQRAASSTPKLVLAVAAAAEDIPSSAPGFVGTLSLLHVYGLSWMCAMGGASGCASPGAKCCHVPWPDPGTKMGLPEQKLGTSEGDCSELCCFRASMPWSEVGPHQHRGPALLPACCRAALCLGCRLAQPFPKPMSSPAFDHGSDLAPKVCFSTGCQSQLRAWARLGKRQIHRAPSRGSGWVQGTNLSKSLRSRCHIWRRP